MAPVYLFHCAQICDIITAGDTVIDLGCGPATQIAMAAELNPDTNFIGVDLSDEMLQRAAAYAQELQLSNLSFKQSDICKLDFLEDHSVDAVVSTVALHHLPDLDHLERVFSEVNRVHKPGGGVYIVDFGHLKAEKSIEYVAYQYADRQPELFTLDYLYSLQAAFLPDDFKRLAKKYLSGHAELYSTFGMPYMMAIKSPGRNLDMQQINSSLQKLKTNIPDYHKKDHADLRMFFKLGGLKSQLLND